MASLTALLILNLLTLLGFTMSYPMRDEPRQSQRQPLLSTAQQAPDLSSFYSLFASTGGSSEVPGPDLETRFDDPTSSMQFTLLAPTNDALESIAPAFIETLTSIPAYDLLLTLLRNFVLPGTLTPDEIIPRKGLEAIEGFTFDIGTDGAILTNEGMTQSTVSINKQANLILDANGRPVTDVASNGIIYKIDKMLDPLITYFGEDAPGQALPPVTRQPGSMANILRQHTDLTLLSPILDQVDPGFVDRLSLYSMDAAVNRRTVYLAPSNTAFEFLPASIGQSVTQPSNHGANSFLLEFGLGEHVEGSPLVQSRSGFNITIDGGRANNAGVQERICADNGCVWLLGRWLDPLYGAFP